MTFTTVNLGTRGSELARWQTDHVAGLLRQVSPDLHTATTVISTKGDEVLDTPLPLVGGKGLFTAELEAALRGGSIDLAVHSLKDLPTEDPDGLVVGAIPLRADPSDVMVSREGYTLETLPQGAVIGTSSNRRAGQIRLLRPDLKMHDIRGNINTRIRKALDPDGPYDAILLARAGLARLKMDDVISMIFPLEQMLPAPGQGALGVQCRDEDKSRAFLATIHHTATALAVMAERAFLAGLGGGCSVPVAAYAKPLPVAEDATAAPTFKLTGRVCAVDGSGVVNVDIEFTGTDAQSALNAGDELARQALDKGANELLAVSS